MIPRRSVFAFVVAALFLAGTELPGGAPKTTNKSLPTIFVEAAYPGASAVVVADTVAAPIEQQVNGAPNLHHMTSRCTSDGKYVLVLTLKPGADLKLTRVVVQNRVALALPLLPKVVQEGGVTVKSKAPLLLMVSLSCADDRYDTIFMSNYAVLYLKDELCRAAGVSDAAGFGLGDYSLRIWLDPAKLAARNMVAGDVLEALAQQNLEIAKGQVGQPPADDKGPFIAKTKGRLTDPEEFANIIVKTNGKGDNIPLRDVGRLELGSAPTESYVSLNGKPAVVLGIYPSGAASAKETSRAIAETVARLRPRLPKGLRLDVAVDFTANQEVPPAPKAAEYVALDLQLPDDASGERVEAALTRCAKLLGEIAGVKDVLALSANPFDILGNRPCILLRLAAADQRQIDREAIMRAVRKKLDDIKVTCAFRGAKGDHTYPIDLAVSGPDADKVRQLAAAKLAVGLAKNKKLTDVWANEESTPRAGLFVDIDRTRAADQGVQVQDIFSTLQVFLGSAQIGEFNRFGRTWQVNVQVDEKARNRTEDDLKQIKVRNKRGQMIPLANVATVRTTTAPRTIHRLDLMPMVQITANPAPEPPLAQARALCEAMFEQMRKEAGLPPAYRLTWLGR